MPKTESKKKFKISGLKNWLILGAATVGGYFVYTKFVSPELKEIKEDIKDAAKKSSSVPGPDLNGPAVNKFAIAGTHSKICITTPDKRFVYAPISSTNALTGNQIFSAPVTGNFTRRLLCKGGRKWAELKPTS